MVTGDEGESVISNLISAGVGLAEGVAVGLSWAKIGLVKNRKRKINITATKKCSKNYF